MVSLYVWFLLTKEEMERNGITSHQIIKFSYRKDPKTPAFARLLNVFDYNFSKSLEAVLQNEDSVIRVRKWASFRDREWLLKVFPRVDVNEESGKMTLQTAQDEAYRILLYIIRTLKCEVSQELPDLKVRCPDDPSTWVMTIKRGEGNYIIHLQEVTDDIYREPGILASTIVAGTDLKNILFCLQYVDNARLRLTRLYDLRLDSIRKVETFICERRDKISSEVLLELKIKIELFSRVVANAF